MSRATLARYVAIGDSTTEGLEDPDGHGGYRGWANRLAEHLARAQGPIEYANLAIRGLTARQVRVGQLEQAVAMRPDVATVVAGVNDLLRPSFALDEVAQDIAVMIHRFREEGAVVLTFTMPDMTRVLPLARILRGRLLALNQRLRETCAASGALLLDLEHHEVAGDPRLWHHDRLHANTLGHERIGAGLAHRLGLPGHGAAWAEALPPAPRRTPLEIARGELDWAHQHLLPWVARHARGRSSSDGRGPKRPALSVFSPEP
jgi:lysophospholipase L1-like esterase